MDVYINKATARLTHEIFQALYCKHDV